MITTEQRTEWFEKASKAIQYLYSSAESGKKLFEIFQKHNFSEDKYILYARSIGDVILGFYPKSQLASLLQQNLSISAEQAELLAADLAELLAPVPDTSPTTAPTSVAPTNKQPAAPQKPMVGYAELQERRAGVEPEGTLAPKPIPPYQKPLTDTPRYAERDPYHEPIE